MTPIILSALIASLFTLVVGAPPASATLGIDDYPYRNDSPSAVDPWGFYKRECVSFVTWRMNNDNRVAFTNNMRGPNGQTGHWGNAWEWWGNALAIGYARDFSPVRGAVAYWSKYYHGAGSAGHVAYVDRVNLGSNGTVSSIVVEEYNNLPAPNDHKWGTRTINAGSSTWPYGFIHIKDLPDGSPFGSFDGATGRVGGAVQVSGWTIDPDAPTIPTAVHVYIDGPAGSGARGVNLGLADVPRPDVGAANPGAGNNHGFNTTITGVSPGVHTLYAYAINAAGGGANPLLRTLQATVPGPDPIGRLDSAHGAVGGFIGVNGWTIDPDAPTTPGQVHVYIDGPAGSGARGVAVPASVDRPDVAAAYPGAGPAHGYSSAIGGISPGAHKIWVYLINIAGGGSNKLLTTADVSVPAVAAGSPFGSFDGASDKGGGAAQVTGWTIDPDARTTPTQVHIYIDGPAGSGVRGVNLGLADASRPDVGAAFPGSGDTHGFNATITGLRPGVHTLWAYAINAAGGGANPLLRTLQVTVSG
jgi:surface antigen